jgi:hypothetical protein
MSAILYTNPKGNPVTRGSYSSSQLFNSCRYKYKQEKILGIRRKEKSGAMQFGKALEDAIQYYHDNGLKPDSGVDHFKLLFLKHKDDTELVYTKRDQSWQNLYVAGAQMLKLYEILLPTFPIVSPVFQLSYSKEVFPGTDLSGLEQGGFVDMLSKGPWVHPLLPKVKIPGGASHRPIGIDIKTGGAELNLTAGLLALDMQIRSYAWLSGVDTWAFLWFTKSIVDSFQKGVEVTFLTSTADWTSGDKATIFKYDEETKTALLSSEAGLQKIAEMLAEVKGKGSTERKEAIIQERIMFGDLLTAHSDNFTKQKVQFLAVVINDEAKQEAGDQIAKDLVEIHAAHQTDSWPRNPGVRFPDTRCLYCSHRGLCLGDKSLVDQLLVQKMDAAPEEVDDDSFGFGEE